MPDPTIKRITIRADQGDGVNWCEWYFHNVPADVLEAIVGRLRGAEESKAILALANSRPRSAGKAHLKRQTRGITA